MANLTARDKRTLRLAGIGISIYLALFFGWRGWSRLEASRRDYLAVEARAQQMQANITAHENKVLLYQKLKTALHLDPATLPRASLVADASAAIQMAAAAAGVQLGPVRETSARAAAGELASMQIEAAGTIAGALGLFHRLETLGFPLAIDAVQLSPDAKPGVVKISLTIVILDYEQWKKEATPRA